MFYPTKYICKYVIKLNMEPAKHFKQLETGASKDWESCGMLRNTC